MLILQAIAWHACLICVSALQSKQAKYLDIMKGLVKLALLLASDRILSAPDKSTCPLISGPSTFMILLHEEMT